MRLVSISRVRRFPLALIIAGDEAPSSLFVLTKAKGGHEVLYREKFLWSFSSVFAAIQNDFHVSGVVARELYAAYCARAMSVSAAKVLKKTIQPVIASFFDEIKKSKVGGSVYVDAPYDMPFELPLRAAGVSIENVPASEILSEVDFSADAQALADRPGVLFRYLAPFFESYFDKNNSEINQKLRRRLHWLAQ